MYFFPSVPAQISSLLNTRQILIAGDSAGGNLALATLLHLSHPHPSIPPVNFPSPTSKLRGVLLMSPWVSFSVAAPSYTRNQYRDCTSPAILNKWSALYLAGKPSDAWNQPLLAPEEWWSNLRAKSVLIAVGKDENMVDDTVKLARMVQKQHHDTTVVATEREGHTQLLIDRMLGCSANGEQETAVREWVLNRV